MKNLFRLLPFAQFLFDLYKNWQRASLGSSTGGFNFDVTSIQNLGQTDKGAGYGSEFRILIHKLFKRLKLAVLERTNFDIKPCVEIWHKGLRPFISDLPAYLITIYAARSEIRNDYYPCRRRKISEAKHVSKFLWKRSLAQ